MVVLSHVVRQPGHSAAPNRYRGNSSVLAGTSTAGTELYPELGCLPRGTIILYVLAPRSHQSHPGFPCKKAPAACSETFLRNFRRQIRARFDFSTTLAALPWLLAWSLPPPIPTPRPPGCRRRCASLVLLGASAILTNRSRWLPPQQ